MFVPAYLDILVDFDDFDIVIGTVQLHSFPDSQIAQLLFVIYPLKIQYFAKLPVSVI